MVFRSWEKERQDGGLDGEGIGVAFLAEVRDELCVDWQCAEGSRGAGGDGNGVGEPWWQGGEGGLVVGFGDWVGLGERDEVCRC